MGLAVVVALACPAALPTEVSALVGTRKYTITVDTVGVALPVALPADSVWKVLPGVYKAMGLPLDENNPATRRLGTCWRRVRGRLAGVPLSKYLDCGALREMPNADRNDVDIVVLTAVREENGVVALVSLVLGWSHPSEGGGRQWCQSRGALERRIQVEVKQAS